MSGCVGVCSLARLQVEKEVKARAAAKVAIKLQKQVEHLRRMDQEQKKIAYALVGRRGPHTL